MLTTSLSLLSMTGFTAAAVLAATSDFKRKTIPNGLVLTLLAGFLLLAPGSGWTQAEITGSLLAGSIVVFVGLTIHALGWAGAGDGKYAAVCTLWIGATQALDFLFLTTVFGALFTMTLLGANRLGWSPLSPRGHETGSRQITIPYGFALSAAALFVIPQSPWM
ncbi:A24 family peptidase [Thalassovita aquimarina]|uniref:A24 family peptidase n=1 Tax=Thalassovita aquimarina TaxID=2785917 RepID=UPI00356837FE